LEKRKGLLTLDKNPEAIKQKINKSININTKNFEMKKLP
jgi:hypothetical protein